MSEISLNEKLNNGLSADEVSRRVAEGLYNGEMDIKTKSYGQIFKDNILSLFNLVNVILLGCIISVGSYKNALFFLVVIWNVMIGIIQEIRAKHTIEKLSLVSAPKAYVLRDGEVAGIMSKDIVLGDIMKLENGNQICADAVILDGSCEVNESLLTGENEPVMKKVGDHLLSGSFLVAGSVLAEVEHIGEDNYVNKITLGAKYYKKSVSVIMRSVKTIVKVIAIAIIPLAGLLVWNNFLRVPQDFTDAMIRTVAAVSAMIPGGLVLLVSIVLAVSVVRLAVHKTLVQDLYSVENLARVDVLCMDKTGTITEGMMTVDDIVAADPNNTEIFEIEKTLFSFAENINDHNATIDAVRNHFNSSDMIREDCFTKKEDIEVIPFSSDKKWSLIYYGDTDTSYILGAPEFVVSDKNSLDHEMINSYADEAKRVVLFAMAKGRPQERGLPKDIVPLAFVILSDKIRSGVRETLDYFRNEDVDFKIISGDDPHTVSRIAEDAGIENAAMFIDAQGLIDHGAIKDAVDQYTIFGRVTPYQKIDIIKALKEKGHTVAMIGDGANDVLALKEADCSIAMQTGSDAARNVSNMVLLDSDFSVLPMVVAEGRKSINNLQRSASLYLTKTTYAFIMAIMFIFLVSIHYPFESIQVTLIGVVTIGVPSFFLALEPNNSRVREHFLFNVFKIALPSGVFMVMAMMASVFLGKNLHNASVDQLSTIATYVALICGLIVIFNICGKLNAWKGIMIAALIIVIIGAVTIVPQLFSIVSIPMEMWWLIIVISAIFFVIHTLVIRILLNRYERQREKQRKFLKR